MPSELKFPTCELRVCSQSHKEETRNVLWFLLSEATYFLNIFLYFQKTVNEHILFLDIITFLTHFSSGKHKLFGLLNFYYKMKLEKREPKRNLTKCFSDESSSIPTGLHVSKLERMQEKENDHLKGNTEL